MTQYEKILEHLENYKTITSWEAIKKYRITRLSAIILLLKRDGYKISSEMIYKKDSKFAKYTLEEE